MAADKPTSIAYVPKKKASTIFRGERAKKPIGRPKRPTIEIEKIEPGMFTPEKWASCIGYITEGMATADAVDMVGIPRHLLEGFLRSDARIKAQWEEAKIAALRRDWDIETIEDILADIAAGDTVEKCVKMKRGLDPARFFKLVMKDPLVKDMYNEARMVQAEKMGDDIIDIADDDSNDTNIDGKGNSAAVNRSRVKVDTRKYIMQAVHHKRWGNKSTQEIDAKVIVDHALTLENARRRVEQGVTLKDVTPEKPALEHLD